tara:strand:+ start:811 stop:1326 length:516 start_codon:yes stop_codon:yes gene_type:complete
MNIEYENPWFKVIKDGKYHYLKENGSDNGAVVLVLINDDFIFVKVSRPAHSIKSLEAPRGYGDVGESSESCAIRELYEETGYSFETSDLENIGVVRPNTAILSSSIPVYLIESGIRSSVKLSGDEISEVVYISKEEVYKQVTAGKITDGITLAALGLYWARNHNKQSQADA